MKAFTKALKITVWEICQYKDGSFHQGTENNSMRNMLVQRWKLSPRHWNCHFQCLGESFHLCTDIFLILLFSVHWWKPSSLYSSISHTVIFSALVKASIFVLAYFSYCYFQCLGESLHLCTDIFLILSFSVPWWKLPSLYWHISHTVIFSALVKASIFVLTYFSYCYFQCLKITVWEILEYKDGGFHQGTENNSMRNTWVQRWRLSPTHWK
jgi:hypothetical protein